jgi:hypothetical protein
MSWARLDDGFDDHPKVMSLLEDDNGAAAIGLWTLCLTWAHRNTRKRGKTPGDIPAHLPRRYLGPAGSMLAALLVKEELWESLGEEGWHIHDFDQYLPSEEKSRAAREAGARGGRQRALSAGQELRTQAASLDAQAAGLNMQARLKQPSSQAVGTGSKGLPVTDPIPTPTASLPEGQKTCGPGTDDGMAPASAQSLRRCAGTTKAGYPCRNSALTGSSRCAAHDPDRAAKTTPEDPLFATFWAAYPRKVARPDALKSWNRAVAVKNHSPATIIAAARAYAADPRRKPDYTAHPTTWLNQERYNDHAERDTGW